MNVSRATTERPSLVLAVLSAAILLDALDLSITQVALPSVQRELALSAGVLPWVATGYALTFGGFLLLGGRAADLYGRRAVFLGGLVVFAVMSGGGLAPNAGCSSRPGGAGNRCGAHRAGRRLDHHDTLCRGASGTARSVSSRPAHRPVHVGLVLGAVLTDSLAAVELLVKVPSSSVVAAALLALPRATAPAPPAGRSTSPGRLRHRRAAVAGVG